ncbi:MAG: hypothetical protein DIU52_000450 [bacterium]|jgi:hypothetical protein|nr:MAG: hypothetical protein DIU52_09340 [bacterium]
MPYGGEFERRRPWRGGLGPFGRWPKKPARGFPVRGFHTYDLDYGRQAGGPDTEYSGRAGWPTAGTDEAASSSRRRGAWEYGAWYGEEAAYGLPERRHPRGSSGGRGRIPPEPWPGERGARRRPGTRRRRWP